MRNVFIINLLSSVAQAHAQELESSHNTSLNTSHGVNSCQGLLEDELVGRLPKEFNSFSFATLDDTIRGKRPQAKLLAVAAAAAGGAAVTLTVARLRKGPPAPPLEIQTREIESHRTITKGPPPSSRIADHIQALSKGNQTLAAATLFHLTVPTENPKNKDAIWKTEGGIETLIQVLREGSPEAQMYAAGIFGNLVGSIENQDEIREAGGIQPLIHVLREGSKRAQMFSACALANLAGNDKNNDVIREEGGIQPLVQLLREGSREARTYTSCAFAHLAVNTKNQDAIREAGGIQPLIQVLSEDGQEAQEHAAAAMMNLAVNSQNARAIGKDGGVQPLIAICREGSREAKTYARAALWNLDTGSADISGIFQKVLQNEEQDYNNQGRMITYRNTYRSGYNTHRSP